MAIFLITGYLGKTLINSDYFKIKDIIFNKGKDGFDGSTSLTINPERSRRIDFSYLIGYNIFALNLENESRHISELYPAYSNIRLIRILPNRLFISLTQRKPLAYVKLYRYFCVDKDAVLLDVPGKPEELQLPVILGLEAKIFGARAGKQYNKELAIALNIIKEFKINSLLKNYRIERIDVASPVNASCFLMPLELPDYTKGQAPGEFRGFEVRIGQDNIRNKIGILQDSFIQLRNDLGNIKYIDLRFKEPVIKFK